MIIVQDIWKSFGEKDIIKGMNITISAAERVAIIGPSGCGKSTLLRLLMGLHMVDKGKVSIDGVSINDLSISDIRTLRLKFGMLFQHAALFDSMTVADNIAFPLRQNPGIECANISEKVEELLELVEMPGFGHRMPSELSGGQQKRIGLARAIATNPKIVLYDEPTTGLDPILSTNIENLIVKLAEELGATSIIVTHQISTILRTADKIYLMKNGALLAPETPETVAQSECPDYREFMSGGLKA